MKHPDDAEVCIDISDDTATIALCGDLGPRTASVLRAWLEALDGLRGVIELDTHAVSSASSELVETLVEAGSRRRSLGCAGIRLTSQRCCVNTTPDVDLR